MVQSLAKKLRQGGLAEESVQTPQVKISKHSKFHLTKISLSGRKKRDTEEGSGVRQARAAGPDLVTSREFECVQTGNKGYWKYDYTIPDKCYSKETEIRGLLSASYR